MKRTLLLLLLVGVATPAGAGPNAGGAVTLHWNSSVPFTSDAQYLDGGLQSCSNIVTQAPPCTSVPPSDDQKRVWFAYAVFPPESVPRLKALCFGINFRRISGGQGLSVSWGRKPSDSIEFPGSGWPYEPGTGTVLVFNGTRTGLVEEVYVFAGYATAGERFNIRKHPTMDTQFGDDAIPSNLDDIHGFGTIGFGVEGSPACPGPVQGACCLADGGCEIMSPMACRELQANYLGNDVQCEPDICDQPIRLCAFGDSHCEDLMHAACNNYGGSWYGNATCPGACCLPNGDCLMIALDNCERWDGIFIGIDVPCEPDPCHEPSGACCYPDGLCTYVVEAECPTGDWRQDILCDPENPCQQPEGACCYPDGRCAILPEAQCSTGDWRQGVLCEPANPCPQPEGACCDLASGECQLLTAQQCADLGPGHEWRGPDTTCTPNPCTPTPTETSTWGRIKHRYQ